MAQSMQPLAVDGIMQAELGRRAGQRPITTCQGNHSATSAQRQGGDAAWRLHQAPAMCSMASAGPMVRLTLQAGTQQLGKANEHCQ